MRKLTMIGVAAAFALGLAAAALAGGGYGDGPSTSTTTTTSPTTATKTGTYSFKAKLTAAQERPAPKGAAGAVGTFTARSVEANGTTTFTWKLRFSGLTGKAVAAHVHLGKKGISGPPLIVLCGPCRNGQTGKVTIEGSAEAAMEKGKAYVNVHTAKNAGGEIRGQVVLTGK
jgi:hypothetical protein